jgi:malate dehydrogenase (oxaloacetate-decarboxylating)
MAHDPIVFALANPDPEIAPEDAQQYVRVMATGRSDYANQINNVLCFPGFFRGLLDVRAQKIVPEMKVAAADAIADVISENELNPDYIIPSVFDRRVVQAVAAAVSQAAIQTGVARRQPGHAAGQGHPARPECGRFPAPSRAGPAPACPGN